MFVWKDAKVDAAQKDAERCPAERFFVSFGTKLSSLIQPFGFEASNFRTRELDTFKSLHEANVNSSNVYLTETPSTTLRKAALAKIKTLEHAASDSEVQKRLANLE